MPSVKHVSNLRAEQAAATRSRILEAARQVFEERGFAGARIEDVGRAAGVAVPTVYKVFTNKRNLLAEVVDRAMTGASYGGTVEDQEWWKEQLSEPDPRRQLRLIARNARQIYERAGSVLEVVRASAPLDPGIAAMWNGISSERLRRSRRTARRLVSRVGRDRVRFRSEELAMTLWSLTGPELFTTHVGEGRSADQYERWLGDVLEASILLTPSRPVRR
ncbi:MAG: TetR/AcrR family transcriptional regulator [Actinomycetota bacterium]